MKSESAIQKQISRLNRLVEDGASNSIKDRAYEAKEALRWAMWSGKVTSWTPAGMLEKEHNDITDEPRR